MNTRPKLILASSSPRRRQLLQEAGYEFEIVPPDESVEKGLCSNCSPAELVSEHAFHKAKAIASELESGLILAADTVGECNGQILGKPAGVEHARQMLELMSGKTHRVLTGVCLWHRPTDQQIVHVEQTVLTMDPIQEDWLDRYLETNDWVGKAGAFGYQDGLDWIQILKGSESNVVGLPLEALERLLEQMQGLLAKD